MFETIMTSVTDNILEIILTIISCVVSYYLIPAIKKDVVPWLKEKRVYELIKTFVQAVEKMAEAGAIEKIDKKKKVIELLENNGIEINESIEAAIESAVKELDIINKTIKDEFLNEEESQ